MYQEDFGAQATARTPGAGRDRGTNVAGDKPDRSPGDTSDLPPTGQELLETEDNKKPRPEKVRDKFLREFGDAVDTAKEEVQTVQNLLDRPTPTGHPEVAVNAGPMIGPEVPQHSTIDPGSVAELLMVAGVIGYQAGRWVTHKVEARRR